MTIKPDGSYDWDTDALQRHAMLVMQALEAAVENLDDTSSLSMILQQLGCKHFAYQVQEHMFNVKESGLTLHKKPKFFYLI